MMITALLLQAAQPVPVSPTAQPDIQLDVRLTARRVVIEKKGDVDLTLRTSLNGREGEGNVLEVQAPELPAGRRELNNVEVRVRAEARLPTLQNQPARQQEPVEPQ